MKQNTELLTAAALVGAALLLRPKTTATNASRPRPQSAPGTLAPIAPTVRGPGIGSPVALAILATPFVAKLADKLL